MKVGITGHQEREGVDWGWVGETLMHELANLTGVRRAFSSLAVGSDQVFARAAMSVGIPVTAVIPVNGYDRFFAPDARAEYRRLLGMCDVTNLGWTGDDQEGFFAAGKFIVDKSDLLFAVWDGKQSKGIGGTADVVAFALAKSRRVIHIDPILQRVAHIGADNHG
ncbi:hypothetical protein [Bradyrhizobium vignae]|uniref:DUF1273 family protein n=1 Tax=Bradyrhizobium vignae TaxID=1549949 RepID=A0A2U3PUD5_9BRAD|nr:hypothetical protein [Bradyrhizobium vignae]SPP92765.1 conserved protein of unknown function [Bradyrhizobium vignae]